jgi:AraC-like DNA-binding protein
MKRNQLAKFIKHPTPDQDYRALSLIIDQGTLKSMSEEYNLNVNEHYAGECVFLLKPDKLLKNYLESLELILKSTNELSQMITNLKVREGVMLMLQINPELKNILFDFSEPGKIDLEAYMNEHYRFNVDISRFAYLTGRSLATFKRDFTKIFKTSPNRWLQQKRLNDAYYMLKEKSWKPSDVYLEVGFKDFSHFSFAFKKLFGCAPSQI